MNTTPLNSLDLAISAQADNVALARISIALAAAHADITMSALEEIKVAVSEAVSNAIIHGYGEDGNQMVHIAFRQYSDRLEVAIHDDGVGIADIEQAMQPEFSSCADRMGLGFAFMHSFMDKLTVISEPLVGTTITMTKFLPEQEAE